MSDDASFRFAKDQLRAFVERIERLEEEKKTMSDDIKDVFGEAKSNGFDTKAIRKIIRLRKIEPTERAEQEAILDVYLHALGMVPGDAPANEAAQAHVDAVRDKQARRSESAQH